MASTPTTGINLLNSTSSPYFSTTVNPWIHESEARKIIEVLYLTILSALGTLGNLVVIFSISLEKRVHAHGNIFIINLALADIMVTGLVVPTVIANVIQGGNALHVDGATTSQFCTVIGFMVTTTCSCSICNLMCIALNRFWAVVKSGSYNSVFSRKRVYFMMFLTWVWACLLTLPTVLGWGGIKYDAKIMVCVWDDEKSRSYTIFVTSCAVFVPLCVIALCYWKLFHTVQASGKWVRSLSLGSGLSTNNTQHRRSVKKERALLRTLAVTVIIYCVCWLPYGLSVLIDPININYIAKKIFGWLALSNSAVNFMIYGAMNPVFRRGYKNLFLYVFTKQKIRRVNSTALHGSQTEGNSSRNRKASPLNHAKATTGLQAFGSAEAQSLRDNNLIQRQETQLTFTSNPSTPQLGQMAARNGQLTRNNSNSNKYSDKYQRARSMSLQPRKLLALKSSGRNGATKLSPAKSFSSEMDKIARSKRNSLMLLQLSVSEDDLTDDDVIKRLKHRSQSDELISPVVEEEVETNANNNNLIKTNQIIRQDTWNPPSVLYRSASYTSYRFNTVGNDDSKHKRSFSFQYKHNNKMKR